MRPALAKHPHEEGVFAHCLPRCRAAGGVCHRHLHLAHSDRTVKTFRNFLGPLPEAVKPSDHTTVIVWCETFSQFIAAAQYR
ncbi:MAG: hypothetical protein C0453_02875 [Comamonadaceae bacterium]|nr:hypothetical protein [Comamonadaceae bacterium]